MTWWHQKTRMVPSTYNTKQKADAVEGQKIITMSTK